MNHYNILIIDDSEMDVRKLQLTFVNYCQKHSLLEPSFLTLNLNNFTNVDKIFAEIKFILEEEQINLVLIDFKINGHTFNGNQIYEKIHNSAPFFPVAILTNRPVDCLNDFKVDAQFIYEKKHFNKTDTEESNKLVHDVLYNIDLYLKKLEENFQKNTSYNNLENLENYIEIQNELSNLIPNYSNNTVIESVNSEFIKVSSLLKEVDAVLEIIRKKDE